MAFGMAIAGRHGMAQAGQWGMRLGVHEGWVVVFSGGSANFRATLAAGDEIHVDWGDGTSNTYGGSGSITRQHTYADNEEYTVTISGAALKVWFEGAGTRLKRVLPCDPVKLLRNNDISYCFFYCTGLTSIPSTLFGNAPLLTNAYRCFYNCSGLTSLPNDLFSNVPSLTRANDCFAFCSGLTSLPNDLFSNTPLLTRASSCFASCTGLTSIPSTLFGNAPLLTHAGECFYGCTEVTGSIPALWTNPNITSYNSCYYNTGKQLTAPPNWSHSVDNICAAACAGWTGGQWTGEDYCNCP